MKISYNFEQHVLDLTSKNAKIKNQTNELLNKVDKKRDKFIFNIVNDINKKNKKLERISWEILEKLQNIEKIIEENKYE